MKKWILVTVTVFSCLATISSWAIPSEDAATKTVIENWFTAMKNNQTEQAASFLAPQFQSIHTDGIARNKAQEVELIKNLNMKSYHLTNFKFSQNGNTMVVTYFDKGAEEIDNNSIDPTKAGRMAVLQKQNGKWVIIAYANLDKIG